MPSEIRLQRIADRIKQELAEMLIFELNDPRIQGIYITDVKVDRELAYANIYVSAHEGAERAKDILAGLESASGYIRRILAGRVVLRHFPQLRFFWDPTPEKAAHIEEILADIRAKDTQSAENDNPETETE